VTRRFLPFLLAVALVGSGCNSQLGRTEPACGEDVITTAIIILAQSVRGAAYAPCINELKPGWEYEHLEARNGRARFWISSDRAGERFLEVTFEGSCDIGEAVETESDDPPIPRYVDTVTEDFHIRVTVVPEGSEETNRDYAAEIVSQIAAIRAADRLVEATVDSADAPTSDRIESALDAARAVLVVGAREVEEGTVELHVRRDPRSEAVVVSGLSATEAVAEIAEPLGVPVYRAAWYYPFENGCVTYRFDARGAGVERIAREVQAALGFSDLAPLRAFGEQVGYVVP
jgi:hypothetical protein